MTRFEGKRLFGLLFVAMLTIVASGCTGENPLDELTGILTANQSRNMINATVGAEILLTEDGEEFQMQISGQIKAVNAASSAMELEGGTTITALGSETETNYYYQSGFFHKDRLGVQVKAAMDYKEAIAWLTFSPDLKNLADQDAFTEVELQESNDVKIFNYDLDPLAVAASSGTLKGDELVSSLGIEGLAIDTAKGKVYVDKENRVAEEDITITYTIEDQEVKMEIELKVMYDYTEEVQALELPDLSAYMEVQAADFDYY